MKSIIMAILLLLGSKPIGDRPFRPVGKPFPGGSLVISEIMSDPDPPVGLPPYEYVEWYNGGADTIDLAGWQWIAGDKMRSVASGRVAPGDYVIVCPPAAVPAFSLLGQVIAMESFPALRNSGDRLVLLDPAGNPAHIVEYSPDQYADALKVNGGWSLELVDLSQYCNPLAWLPSSDPSGGTPGKANSQQVAVTLPEPPMLIRAAGYDQQRFVLLFSGILNPVIDMNNYSCTLTPGPTEALAAQPLEYGFPGLFFQLPESLDKGFIYTVEFNGTVSDCSGQHSRLRPVLLGFPSEPDSADVVFSEILFDPRTDQVEFIEVYNRSERVLETRDLIIARANTAGTIMSFSDQQEFSYWLFPGCYAVFTSSPNLFNKAWPMADPAAAAGRPDMPSLTNEESRLILMDRNQKELDAVIYSPDWHYPYLEETKGVSLERINPEESGTNRTNWLSASAASGYSTPGVKNSCALSPTLTLTNHFTLDPSIGYTTGFSDPVQLAVSYRFDEAGWFLRMNVVSGGGLPIREIFPFGLAGVEGIVSWNGLDTANRLVADGIYLVIADYYHPSGKKGRWNRACAIVRAY